MNEKSKCRVEILGEEYSLISDEPSKHIVDSAELVDRLMKEVMKSVAVVDARRAAVLVAIRFASEMLSSQRNLFEVEENLRKLNQKQAELSSFIEQELPALQSS